MIIPEELAIHEPKEELLKIINSKKFNDKCLYSKTSDFHDIKVIENEVGRFLHYAETYQAGFINTDFYKGNLPYINYFLLPFFYKKNISKVLLIGHGTGKIITDLFKLFPNIKEFDSVDIEENIFDISKKFFGFKQNSKTNLILQDALVYLKTTSKKYDLIIVDVANNSGIDDRFLDDEYFDLIKKHLKSGGIFVSNLCSSPDIQSSKNLFYKKLNKIYSKNFNSYNIYKGDYSDKIYYKCFFDINERVIDITNLIFISSNKALKFTKDVEKDLKTFQQKFKNIDISQILTNLVK